MLNNGVVDLFCDAKAMPRDCSTGTPHSGARFVAQSPTIDLWNTESSLRIRISTNIHPISWETRCNQASAACYDYFQWERVPATDRKRLCRGRLGRPELLRGGDGRVDRRDQQVPERSCRRPGECPTGCGNGRWLSTARSARRQRRDRPDLRHVHRDVDVLILYPMNLVAVEPRFGDWMAQ